jgi:predicted DNA-binding transcriptional regulator YafY
MAIKKQDYPSNIFNRELSQAEYDHLIDSDDDLDDSYKESGLEQLRRQWQLIKLIPPYQRPKTTATLADHIGNSKDPSFLRKIQRDITQLKKVIGDDLLVKRRGRPEEIEGYQESSTHVKQKIIKGRSISKMNRGSPMEISWGKSGPPIKAANLSHSETIAFGVLKQIGVDWMPDTMQEALKPYFNEAFEEAALQVENNRGVSSKKSASMTKKWLNKIRYLPSRDIVLITPKLSPQVEFNVLEALLNEFLLEIDYTNSAGMNAQGIIISPHALVRRGSRTYLFAKRRGSDGVKPYLMSRIKSAKITIGQFDLEKNFNLEERLKKGIARPDLHTPIELYGELIDLKFWANKETGFWLKETPLSYNQTVTDTYHNDGFIISASVHMMEELIWWLRSMGPNIKILGPKFLVTRIKLDLAKVNQLY